MNPKRHTDLRRVGESLSREPEPLEWAITALHSESASELAKMEKEGLSATVPPDLVAPDGWRWRVLTDLTELHQSAIDGYDHALRKQTWLTLESSVGKIFVGGIAGVGAFAEIIGVAYVKGSAGWILAAVGIALAVGGSVFSASSYLRNRNQKLRYLRLMHDIRDYAYLLLPTAERNDVYAQMDNFRQLWETAGN